MTAAQLQILKTDITVNHAATVYNGKTLLQLWNDNDTENLAAYYNTIATPQVDLWKPDIPVEEVTAAIDYSVFATKTAVLQNTFLLLVKGTFVNATQANIRAGFAVVFPSGASFTNLIALARRAATNGESLFKGALQGTNPNAAYVSSIYGYTVSGNDVYRAKYDL